MNRVMDVATLAVFLLAVVIAVPAGWNRYIEPWLSSRPVEVQDWSSLTSKGHTVGPEHAPVTILELGDYQCPACRELHPVLMGFVDEFAPNVRIIYRHWPLEYHPQARPAAEAAVCAERQGHFLPYHNRLYQTRDWMVTSSDPLMRIASEVGIPDTLSFRACLESGLPRAVVQDGITAVQTMGGTGTPTIVIDGTHLRSQPFEERLRERIRSASQAGGP